MEDLFETIGRIFSPYPLNEVEDVEYEDVTDESEEG